MRDRFTIFLSLFLAMAFFGCAAWQTKETPLVKLTYHDSKKAENVLWPGNGLKQEFERYWSSRFDGLWESTWLMEAPYFQEMTDQKKYKDFIKAHIDSHLLGIEIWSIEHETDNLVVIRCEISYQKQGESKKFFNKDKWVRVRDKWYHIIQDRILFPASL